MKEEFSISEQDYVNAQMLFLKLSKKDIYTHLIAISMLSLAIIYGSSVLRAAGVGGIVGGLSFYLLNRYLILPYNSKRQFRNYKGIQSTMTVELLEDGIKISSPNTQSKVPWENICKWREDDDYLLVYFMPKLFYLLPKKQFLNSDLIPKLIESLKVKVGGCT